MPARRWAYPVEGRARKISQETLLLVGQVESRYLNRHVRSTLARRELGEMRSIREGGSRCSARTSW